MSKPATPQGEAAQTGKAFTAGDFLTGVAFFAGAALTGVAFLAGVTGATTFHRVKASGLVR